MMSSRMRLGMLGALILAGCGTQGVPGIGSAPAGVPNDQQAYAIQALKADLGAMARADANGVAIATGAAANAGAIAVSTGVTPTITTVANLPFGDAAIAAALDIKVPGLVAQVNASSVLDERFFAVKNCTDGNLHSAWAPALSDEAPSLTLDLGANQSLEAMAIKMSGEGVKVDIDASVDGKVWTHVASNLTPTLHALDRLDVHVAKCSQLRVTFHGGDVHRLLVCEVHAYGAGPGMMPSAKPSPGVAPSVMPSAMPSMKPSVAPSMKPSTMPSMMPSTRPSASMPPIQIN